MVRTFTITDEATGESFEADFGGSNPLTIAYGGQKIKVPGEMPEQRIDPGFVVAQDQGGTWISGTYYPGTKVTSVSYPHLLEVEGYAGTDACIPSCGAGSITVEQEFDSSAGCDCGDCDRAACGCESTAPSRGELEATVSALFGALYAELDEAHETVKRLTNQQEAYENGDDPKREKLLRHITDLEATIGRRNRRIDELKEQIERQDNALFHTFATIDRANKRADKLSNHNQRLTDTFDDQAEHIEKLILANDAAEQRIRDLKAERDKYREQYETVAAGLKSFVAMSLNELENAGK